MAKATFRVRRGDQYLRGPETSIMVSSSSETSDNGNDSLAKKSGDTDRDTDRDTIHTEKLTGDSGGDEVKAMYAAIPLHPPPKLLSER